MNNTEIVKRVIDKCSTEELLKGGVPEFLTDAEQISYCFNTELGAYGLKTNVSPDKRFIYIDDEGMSKVLSFFKGKEAQPALTAQHVESLKNLVETANEKNISLIWLRQGWSKRYYLFKQYGFHGVNIFRILNINNINTAAAMTSASGAASISIGGVLALSYSGSLFFSTVENYIPNSYIKTKAAVGAAKVVVSFPLQVAEYTGNAIFGLGETLITGNTLPTNVTSTFRLDQGPQLKNLSELKQPVAEYLHRFVDKYFPLKK